MASIRQSSQYNNSTQTASEDPTNEWGTDRRRRKREREGEIHEDVEREGSPYWDHQREQEREQWERECRYPQESRQQADLRQSDQERDVQRKSDRIIGRAVSLLTPSKRPLTALAGRNPFFRWPTTLARSPSEPPTHAASSSRSDQDWVLIGDEKKRREEEIKCSCAEEHNLPKDTIGAESGWATSFPIAPGVYASAFHTTPTPASPGMWRAEVTRHSPSNSANAPRQKSGVRDHPQDLRTNDLYATVRDEYSVPIQAPIVHEKPSPTIAQKAPTAHPTSREDPAKLVDNPLDLTNMVSRGCAPEFHSVDHEDEPEGLTLNVDQMFQLPPQSSGRGTAPAYNTSGKPLPKKPPDAEFKAHMANLRRQTAGSTDSSNSSQERPISWSDSRSSTSSLSVFSESPSIASLLPVVEFSPTPVFTDKILRRNMDSSFPAAQDLIIPPNT